MRSAAAPGLVAAALLTQLACDPPVPENDAPFVDLIAPRALTADEQTFRVGYAGQPLGLRVQIQDRDADPSFTVRVFAVDGDDRTLLDEQTDVAADTEIELAADHTLALGSQRFEVEADDGGPGGLRVAGFELRAIAADDPVVCWSSLPEICTTNGAQPQDGNTLRGRLLTADNALEYYEWSWSRGDEEPAAIGEGAVGDILPNLTEVGETWTFCVDRWYTLGNLPLAEQERDLQSCVSVEIQPDSDQVP